MDIVDDLRVHLDHLSRTVLLQVRERYIRPDATEARADRPAREADASTGGPRRRFPFVRR
ncbi:hypothetical protein OCK02_03650 (plasmid) [Rhizobium sp. TRM96647]|uniref:hypothetical protein n=1 Tax=unclassified Rhizobium TaxID=2613769 RepID=UPI0021E87B61|nr:MULTISPECIES: hypothetical protein [unclassified Rhizobium]MCV3735288.1 hypothetical protein [Rhizobium sp. TRM96647]MCV3757949.1 hypothetical protein [Rhizobium sp. TRM96650]